MIPTQSYSDCVLLYGPSSLTLLKVESSAEKEGLAKNGKSLTKSPFTTIKTPPQKGKTLTTTTAFHFYRSLITMDVIHMFFFFFHGQGCPCQRICISTNFFPNSVKGRSFTPRLFIKKMTPRLFIKKYFLVTNPNNQTLINLQRADPPPGL